MSNGCVWNMGPESTESQTLPKKSNWLQKNGLKFRCLPFRTAVWSGLQQEVHVSVGGDLYDWALLHDDWKRVELYGFE